MKLRAESTKIFELQTNYLKIMDSFLTSCSRADFEGFSAEKFRIQELVSNIRATIDNLKDKQSARDRIRNKIKMTPIELEVFTGTGPNIGIQFTKWLNTFKRPSFQLSNFSFRKIENFKTAS